MQRGAAGALDAVHRPQHLGQAVQIDDLVGLGALVVGGEAAVIGGVPVLGRDDEVEVARHPVGDRDGVVPVRDLQRPAGAEVVLEVHEDERLVGHGASYTAVGSRSCSARRDGCSRCSPWCWRPPAVATMAAAPPTAVTAVAATAATAPGPRRPPSPADRSRRPPRSRSTTTSGSSAASPRSSPTPPRCGCSTRRQARGRRARRCRSRCTTPTPRWSAARSTSSATWAPASPPTASSCATPPASTPAGRCAPRCRPAPSAAPRSSASSTARSTWSVGCAARRRRRHLGLRPGRRQLGRQPARPGESRDHGCGGVLGGALVVAGGRQADIGSTTATVFALAPGVGWTARASMPTGRGGTACGVIDDRLIVVGGEGNPASSRASIPRPRPTPPAPTRGRLSSRCARPATAWRRRRGGVLYVPAGATQESVGAVDTHETFTPPATLIATSVSRSAGFGAPRTPQGAGSAPMHVARDVE